MKSLYLTMAACLFIGYGFAQNSGNFISRDNNATLTPNSNSGNENPELKIYPNPAKNKISLQVKGFEPGQVLVKTLDMKGNQVREDNRLLVNGNEDVIMFISLQPGVYFIMLKQKDKVVRKKIMVI